MYVRPVRSYFDTYRISIKIGNALVSHIAKGPPFSTICRHLVCEYGAMGITRRDNSFAKYSYPKVRVKICLSVSVNGQFAVGTL